MKLRRNRFVAGLVLVCSICLVETGFSQSQGQLELFYGGIIGADIRVASGGLSEASGTYETLGGSISQLTPGGESVRWNPVGMAYVKSSVLYSEWIPPIHVNLNPFIRVEEKANTALRNGVQDFAAEGSKFELHEFKIQPNVYLEGGQGNFSGILKTQYFAIGAAVKKPTSIRTDLSLSGLKFRAVTEAQQGGTAIRLLGVLSGTLSSEFKLSGYSLSIGRRFWNGLGLGLAYDSYAVSMTATGVFQPEMQVSSGSEVFAFNSNNPEHYDRLQASGDGTFEGEGGRWRFGAGYHIDEKYAFDMALFLPTEIGLSGSFTLDYDQFLAINLNAGKDEAFFDAAQLLEDDFTGTHPRTTLVQDVKLRLPGQFAVSAAMRWSQGRASITFTKYLEDLSMQFNYFSSGDSTATPVSGTRKMGLEPGYALVSNFGAQWLQVRLGAMRATWTNVHSRSATSESSSIWVPLFGFSGGFVFPYYDKFRIDYALLFGVTSFFRIGTSLAL